MPPNQDREYIRQPKKFPHTTFRSNPTHSRQALVWFLSPQISFVYDSISYKWVCWYVLFCVWLLSPNSVFKIQQGCYVYMSLIHFYC